MKYRAKSLATFMLCLVLLLPLVADQKPSFVFGGKKFYIGMSQPEAVRLISDCCQLSPPIEANIEQNPLTAHGGHLIVKKDGAETRFLGQSFWNQKITRLTKPMPDEVDLNEELVAFVRDLKRVLRNDAGEFERVARISVQHEKISNAESDIYLSFFRMVGALNFTWGPSTSLVREQINGIS